MTLSPGSRVVDSALCGEKPREHVTTIVHLTGEGHPTEVTTKDSGQGGVSSQQQPWHGWFEMAVVMTLA